MGAMADLLEAVHEQPVARRRHFRVADVDCGHLPRNSSLSTEGSCTQASRAAAARQSVVATTALVGYKGGGSVDQSGGDPKQSSVVRGRECAYVLG